MALLHPMGCAVGADVFGFTTAAADDGGIGQNWEQVTQVVDVASPMVYPSHYTSGWYEFEDTQRPSRPDGHQRHPDGMERLAERGGSSLAPGFRLHARPGSSQIEVAEEYGLGWMLWNAEPMSRSTPPRSNALWP